MSSEAHGPAEFLDADSRETALASLLQAHPGAVVAALDDLGRLVGFPPTISLAGQHLVEAGTPFEIVDAAARIEIVDAWLRARVVGVASTDVVLTNGSAGVCHVLDLRDRHGVMLGMIVGDSPSSVLAALSNRQAVLPRMGRVHKDEIGVFTFADDNVARILGVDAAVLVGARSLDFIHPDDHAEVLDAWIDMLSSPSGTSRVRARHRRGDGSWVWMELTNVNHLEHVEGCVIADMVDVTAEMAALEAVRHSEQLLRRLAEALPTGVIQVDRDRGVVFTNARLAHVVGIHGAGTVDEQLSTVIPADRARLAAALDRVLVDGLDLDLEVQLRLPGTVELHLCNVTIRALTDAGGRPDGAVVSIEDVTEAAELRTELQRRATVDDLTGCLNRPTVLAELDRVLRRHSAGSPGTAVAFLDLDEFKAINDTYGHETGDQLLAGVVTRLNRVLRRDDVVGRLGGDEFIIVLPEVPSLDEAAAIGRRIEVALSDPLEDVAGQPMRIRASIGVAWSISVDITSIALTAAADQAMYRSKRAGTSQPVLVTA